MGNSIYLKSSCALKVKLCCKKLKTSLWWESKISNTSVNLASLGEKLNKISFQGHNWPLVAGIGFSGNVLNAHKMEMFPALISTWSQKLVSLPYPPQLQRWEIVEQAWFYSLKSFSLHITNSDSLPLKNLQSCLFKG